MRGWHNDSYRHALASRGIRTRWPTEEDFLKHHYTGYIAPHAYNQYSTSEGISWLGSPGEYSHLLKTMDIDGEIIEIRIKLDECRYVRTDKDENIVRDERGMATYLTDAEIKEKGFLQYTPVIVAFNEAGLPIGFSSNEWGTSGVWVVEKYQKKGIGFELLKGLQKYFDDERKMGQMTESGIRLCRSYYRKMGSEE